MGFDHLLEGLNFLRSSCGGQEDWKIKFLLAKGDFFVEIEGLIKYLLRFFLNDFEFSEVHQEIWNFSFRDGFF